MKNIIVVSMLLFFVGTGICHADWYVLRNKQTGEPMGGAELRQDAVSAWEKGFIVEKNEAFRGKQPYEMKYDGGKLRLATKAELDTYRDSLKQQADSANKQELLRILGVTEAKWNTMKQ